MFRVDAAGVPKTQASTEMTSAELRGAFSEVPHQLLRLHDSRALKSRAQIITLLTQSVSRDFLQTHRVGAILRQPAASSRIRGVADIATMHRHHVCTKLGGRLPTRPSKQIHTNMRRMVTEKETSSPEHDCFGNASH